MVSDYPCGIIKLSLPFFMYQSNFPPIRPSQWCYLFAFMIHCFQSCSRREYSLNTAHMTVSNTLVYQSIFLSIQHNRFLKELKKYLLYFLSIKIVLLIIY
jgi:hypothetical protein